MTIHLARLTSTDYAYTCEICHEPAGEGNALCPACAHDVLDTCVVCGVELALGEYLCGAHCAAIAAGDTPEGD